MPRRRAYGCVFVGLLVALVAAVAAVPGCCMAPLAWNMMNRQRSDEGDQARDETPSEAPAQPVQEDEAH